MIIDHVTVHLHSSAIRSSDLDNLLQVIGFKEIPPDERIAEEFKDSILRWFAPLTWEGTGTILHLIADDHWGLSDVDPGLGHFCVTDVTDYAYRWLEDSRFCEHSNPNNERLWINYHGLRIEVRK